MCVLPSLFGEDSHFGHFSIGVETTAVVFWIFCKNLKVVNVVAFLFSNPQQQQSDQNTEFTLGQLVQTTQQIYNPTFVYSVFPSEN